MNPDEIELFSLIALRALAEYSPYEYQRVTDFPKSRIDAQIQTLLGRTDNQYATLLYEQLSSITRFEREPAEVSFLLQQVYNSSSATADWSALVWRAAAETDDKVLDQTPSEEPSPALSPRPTSLHEQLLRLSVMKILHDLPTYSATFEPPVGTHRPDCLLQPRNSGPMVVVEAKLNIKTRDALDAVVQRLRTAARTLGRATLCVLITKTAIRFDNEFPEKFHGLVFVSRWWTAELSAGSTTISSPPASTKT